MGANYLRSRENNLQMLSRVIVALEPTCLTCIYIYIYIYIDIYTYAYKQ